MTEALGTAEHAVIAAVREISDDAERYHEAKGLRLRLDQTLKDIQAEAARNLHEGRSWGEVGKLLGVTGSRAEQISRGSR